MNDSNKVILYIGAEEFNKTLCDFSQLVHEKKYKKVDYSLWNKLFHNYYQDTTEHACEFWTVILSFDKSVLTLGYTFKDRGDQTFDLRFDDHSLGEYLYKKYRKCKKMEISKVFDVELEPCKTTKIGSASTTCIDNNLLTTDASNTFTFTTTAITSKPTLAIDYDNLDEYIHEHYAFNVYDSNKNDDVKKGNEKMKGFNFDFGPCTDNNIRMSMYGLAVKNAAGTWVSYDSKNKEVMDVDIFNFDGGKYFYKIPVAIKDIAIGDVVIHNRKPMFVINISNENNSLHVVDPQAGERKEIMLTKSPFGFNFATKVVSLFNMNTNTDMASANADAPFGNMLPLLLMSSDNVDFDPMLMFMMTQQGNATSANMFSNPMMMYFLMKDNKNTDELLPLMFLMNQNK